MNEPIDNKIGEAGIIDENEAYDLERVQATPAAPDPNEPKNVTIRVPQTVSDQLVHLAWQIGYSIIHRIHHGLVVINFASVGPHPKTGQQVPTIGKFEMVVAKPEDVQRLIKLATIINEQNSKVAAAASRPVELLGATIEATKVKDEALRQLSSEAGGEIPIITAR